jgi:hypothetical protein
VVENGIQRPPIVAITPSGEPMDPFTSKHSRTTTFSCNRYDQRRCEEWTEGIIAIDIQDGYDKFNDNVKILSTALKT